MAKVGLTLLFVLAVGVFYYSAEKTQVYNDIAIQDLSPPPLVDVPPKYMEFATFGHLGVYHTLLNIWSIQYLSIVKTLKVDNLNKVLHKIANHKIRFESFYMLSCFMVGLDLEKPELCKDYSNAALEVFPESWRVPMMQGFVSYFKLENGSEASIYYGLAASRPTSPPYVGSLARKLAKKANLNPEEMTKLYEDLTNSMENSGMGDFFKKLMSEKDKADKKNGKEDDKIYETPLKGKIP